MIWHRTDGYDYHEHWESAPFEIAAHLPACIAHVATVEHSGKFNLLTWLDTVLPLSIELYGVVELHLMGPQFGADSAALCRDARHYWWQRGVFNASYEEKRWLVNMYKDALLQALLKELGYDDAA